MVPLTTDVGELIKAREVVEGEAAAVFAERQCTIPYQVGTMVETPRAALTAVKLAEHADFFSIGSNDLTQTTYGLSRDDAETGFLLEYLRDGIYDHNPFTSIDPDGVGVLIDPSVEAAAERRRKGSRSASAASTGETQRRSPGATSTD